MNDDRPAGHFIGSKSVGQKDGQSEAPVAEKGRHIPGVVGVLTAAGVIVGHDVGKGALVMAAAFRALVYVKAKNGAFAFSRRGRKPRYPRIDEGAPGRGVKPHYTPYIPVLTVAVDVRLGNGTPAENVDKVHILFASFAIRMTEPSSSFIA